MKCAVVGISEAEAAIKDLLRRNLVNKEYRIMKRGQTVVIPLARDSLVDMQCNECSPPERVAGMSPVTRIVRNLERRGIYSAAVPERWIRYGNALILRIEDPNEVEIAEEFTRIMNVRSVYKFTGTINGIFRTPSVKLIFGPGGEAIHLENGLRFIFDPEKIMFSPGNVNERILASKMDLTGKRVLDMFCGIGYFSMPIAKYSGVEEVIAVDINPEAIRYLELTASLNRVSEVIRARNDDSYYYSPEGLFDLVVMGNFRSVELVERALGYTLRGGRIIMHHLVSTDKLSVYRRDLCKRLGDSGFNVHIEDSHAVKSYSPNMWHYSTTIVKE